MTLSFLTPALLFLTPLALLPLLPRRREGIVLSSLAPLAGVAMGWRVRLALLHPWWCALTLLLLLVALAGPVLGERTSTVVRRGIDLMLALDISASMGARDIPPDRMTVAREAAADFLLNREDDRVGVILFSGAPYLLAPPALDKGPVLARLQQTIADRSGSGTALGDALTAALAQLRNSPAKSKAVVLLTDGTSNRGRITPLAAGRAAAALGVRVYAIGFGSEEGAEVPLGPGGEMGRLADGTPLRDALEEGTLQEIARLSGGRYFRASGGDALKEVYRRIDALETTPLEVREHLARQELAPLLLQLAAGLLFLEIVLFRLWLRRVP
jgi:Ca-activated chloride channel family protein